MDKRAVALLLTAMATAPLASPRALRMEEFAPQGLGKLTTSQASTAITNAVAAMKSGDALVLSSDVDFGSVTLASVPDGVQFIGGTGEEIVLQGDVRDVLFFGGDYRVNALKQRATVANTYFVNTSGELLLGNTENTHWIDHTLTPGKKLVVDGTMNNCTMVWMRYNHEFASSSTAAGIRFFLHGSGNGVKVLHFIEHNQQNQQPAVHIKDAVGMALANGSTESCGGAFLYRLENCRDVHLAHRRYFHRQSRTGWGTYAPQITLMVVGGEGNIVDNIVDIADPQSSSLQCTDPRAQFWSCLFEESAKFTGAAQGRFYFSYVTEAMPGLDTWSEPRKIDNETFCAIETESGTTDLTQPGATLPAGYCLPVPPSMPKCDIPKPPALLYKRVAGFGAAAIEAGADPTGASSSNEAFVTILRTTGVLELAPGTYRLDRPLVVDETVVGARRKIWVVGSGTGVTRIIGPARGPLMVAGSALPGLARQSASSQAELLCADLDFVGGDYGFQTSGINVVQKNVRFKDQTKAGIYIVSSNAEQNRFISCDFVNTGDYGIRMEGYSDKYLFYRCSFTGQKKGGLYGTNLSSFHSGVYQCTFNSIDGPGVFIDGFGHSYGYGPWVFTVDNCTFTECGSSTEPVVHFGVSWEAAFTHSTIAGTKPVAAGFEGCFAIIDHLDIDVNGPSMKLGHGRWEKTAGVGGSRVANVTANGAIEFLTYDGYVTDPKFRNEAMIAQYNSVHPLAFAYLFYNVKSANLTVPYGIVNNGAVAVDLSRFAPCGAPSANRGPAPAMEPPLATRAPRAKLYDLRGRYVATAGEARVYSPVARSVCVVRHEGSALPALRLADLNRR